jgi:predicted nucleic acid-binding protein
MRKVLLDSVGLLALWNRSDQWHAAAKQAYAQLIRDGAVPVSTTFVLLECGNAASRHPFRLDVVALRQQLEQAGLLVTPTDSDWCQAWADYEHSFAAQAGIVDCVSFVVMRRLAITDVFSNDRHFQAAGFRPLF